MDFRLPPELVEWRQRVRGFVARELQPHDEEIERTGLVPPHLLRRIAEEGLFGVNTPRAYGGLGLSMLGSCLATEELAKAHTAFYYLCGINVHIGSKPIVWAMVREDPRGRHRPERVPPRPRSPPRDVLAPGRHVPPDRSVAALPSAV